MIEYYYKGKTQREMKLIPEFKRGCWVKIVAPKEEEIKFLVDSLDIDEDLLNDALDPYEVPRVEYQSKNTYLFTRVPVRKNKEILTSPVLIIYTKNSILTVSQREIPSWTHIKNSTKLRSHNTTMRTKFFLETLSGFALSYNTFITMIARSVRRQSVNISSIKNQDIIDLVGFERVLNDFISALVPTNTAIEKSMADKKVELLADDKELFEDISLSFEQLIALSKTSLKNIQNIRSAYSTIMQNNLNNTIKLLTVITITLAVPTMIAGFFGMNVALPVDNENGLVFWLIVVVSFLCSLGLFYYIELRKQK